MMNAKNYLNADELQALNNLVEQYLVFAEGQALRRIPMTMNNWITKLDGFLTLNDRGILGHASKVSYQMAKQLAEQEYDKFHHQRLHTEAVQADESILQLTQAAEQLTKPKKAKKKAQRPNNND